MSGKFITFEGIDGSGKSTQLRLLAADLRAKSLDVITTCEPGGTPLGRHLRAALFETEETVAPLAELLLFAADRAQHVEFLIRPAVAEGRIVISDRYADATTAYQGAGRGFSKELISQVVEIATAGLKPDMTIFLDLPVSTAGDRMAERAEKGNRMDAETAEFYNRVRGAYLDIAKAEPQRFRVIDGTRSPEAIHADVVAEVEKILD